jgi:pimeloyl-ACP methyl ester carboxylesterase
MFTNSKLLSFEEGVAQQNDIEIYYRDYGPVDGDPILLVQGIGGQLINWPHHLIEFLIQNNYRPIVFDNRDTGLSTKIESNAFDDENRSNTIIRSYIRYYLRLPIKSDYTLDDMADDAISVLDKLNIDKAHILGISMGGMIAQIIASSYPDKTKTFTLIASTASTPSPLNGPTRKVRKLLMNRTINPNATIDERVNRTRKIIGEIGYQGIDLNTDEFYEEVSSSIQRGGTNDTGFGRQLTAILGSENRLNKVKSIQAPTLIIHGKDDPLIKVKNAYKTNKLIDNSNLIIISDMRHLIEVPVFNQFKDDLLKHLDR